MGRPKKIQPTPQPIEDNVSQTFEGKLVSSGPEPMPSIIEASQRVIYNGQNIRAVLYDDKELRDADGKITHYHCSLEDGTTAHVPVTLFK